jgi:hypothetical protein
MAFTRSLVSLLAVLATAGCALAAPSSNNQRNQGGNGQGNNGNGNGNGGASGNTWASQWQPDGAH